MRGCLLQNGNMTEQTHLPTFSSSDNSPVNWLPTSDLCANEVASLHAVTGTLIAHFGLPETWERQ